MKNRLIISLLAILVLVLGGFAYLMSAGYLKSDKKTINNYTKIESVSKSDEVADIENDLGETEFEDIDEEIGQIEKELL